MRRKYSYLQRLTLLWTILALLLGSFTAAAQGRVSTRKYRLSDFTDKVTKVVLSGNEILSGALREEVVACWTASAFEFCTLEQFEKLKTSDQYYFLLTAETQMKGEASPGLVFLTLVKGGAGAAEGIGEMDEVISLPLCAAPWGSTRELTYLGALVQAVQEFTLAAMESEKVAYSGTDWFNSNYKSFIRQKQVYLAQEDLAPSVDEQELKKYLDDDMHITDDAVADLVYLRNSYNTLVSYVVAPMEPGKGSFSYQLLIESGTHTLYYISKHKITPDKGAGFLPEDLKRLAKKR